LTHTLDPTQSGNTATATADETRSDGSRDPRERRRPVHRLRDLDRRGRAVAALFALALSLAPALAFAWAVPQWTPVGDPALMGIRALDVGSSRTPLIGQPSTAGLYIQRTDHVNHPGPVHFYMLAAAIHGLGGDVGMPLVTVLVVEACVLIAAWAVFRQLGPPAAIIAAVALALVMFTTGTSSLVDPVSSSIAGYPLLCSAVLCWCLLSGDVRLLPLTTAVVSFTAQQHLSVAPALIVVTAAGVVGVVVARVRARNTLSRRELVWWCGWSTVVALVLWAPVLLQQFFTSEGNLSRLATYARSGDRATLGSSSAARQLANSLGMPPLLAQTDATGWKLLAQPSALKWWSAAAVVAIVAALGLRWRTRLPRRATLAVMVGVLLFAGFENGSSVPVGRFEQGRLVFYHWAFALGFFAFVVLGLGLVDLGRARVARWSAGGGVLAAAALIAMVVPTAVNPALDRHTNTLPAAHAYLKSSYVHRLGDAVLDHRGELGRQTVLLSRGGQLYAGLREAVAFELTERGIAVRHPRTAQGFVDGDRLMDPSTLDTGLVLLVDTSRPAIPPNGKLLSDIRLPNRLDVAAYTALILQAQSAPQVRLGPGAERALGAIADPGERFVIGHALTQIREQPVSTLVPVVLRFLRDHPIESPPLDPRLIDRVLRSVPDDWAPDAATGLRLYLVDRAELLRIANPREL
jgi:hypothetical protein